VTVAAPPPDRTSEAPGAAAVSAPGSAGAAAHELDHDHDHAGVHGHHHPGRDLQARALWIALVANSLLMVAEAFGGFAFNSLALLADATHLLSDVVGLGIAIVAQRLVARPATARHSYGFQRAEVVGAQLNALVLLAAAGWIAVEAVQRIGDPDDVRGGGVVVLAGVGLVVNLVSAWLIARSAGRSLNMRGAYLHMVMDAVGSVGAIVAGLAVVFFEADWMDPLVSLLIAGLIAWSTWGLLRDSTNVMLEAAPGDIDPAAVEIALAEDARVTAVHHTHLWSLASDVPAFSAHVVLEDVPTLHEAQAEGDRLKAMLADRFGISHATLELECHACDDDIADTAPHGRAPI
jgi:cobalt-zinc-cadmium efflux system protein